MDMMQELKLFSSKISIGMMIAGMPVGCTPLWTQFCSLPQALLLKSASFAMVVRSAAEILDLQLATQVVKTNVLDEGITPSARLVLSLSSM